MDTTLLGGILDSLKSITTWIAVIGGGVVLTYYMLPSISGKVHANAITLIWITALLAIWSFILQPIFIDPLIIICQYYLSLMIYPLAPYVMMQSFSDTIWLIISLWVVKIAFFPEQHHAKI